MPSFSLSRPPGTGRRTRDQEGNMRTVGVGLSVLSIAAFAAGAPLHAQRGQRNLITAEEIERAKPNLSTAYEAVEMLRPRWFQKQELARSLRR